jgi:hypothetical protein
MLPVLLASILVVGTASPLWGQRAGRLRTAQVVGVVRRAALLMATARQGVGHGPSSSISIDPALPLLPRSALRGIGRRFAIPLSGSIEGRAGGAVTARGISGSIGLLLRF